MRQQSSLDALAAPPSRRKRAPLRQQSSLGPSELVEESVPRKEEGRRSKDVKGKSAGKLFRVMCVCELEI